MTQAQRGRRAKMRPANFETLSARDQWAIDKKLGILDWDGTPAGPPEFSPLADKVQAVRGDYSSEYLEDMEPQAKHFFGLAIEALEKAEELTRWAALAQERKA
jgi:hypothetical protein